MNSRPELNSVLDGKTFLKWYWLKEELVSFCKANGLPATGSKTELTERIACFLDTGKVTSAPKTKRSTNKITDITLDNLIEPNFVCSEVHRAFFKEQIGASFSFNVAFQKWLKANTGKTYRDAVRAYSEILKDKKKSKTVIDKQFEYNTYVRDFFAANKGRSLDDAIKCWNYKKCQPGHNRYEDSDKAALE
ncbi:MAG: SAP domain-containing protein [Clostridiales bacterium]|nr:SAP domain-containing protein [Clostridiales bacterium]